MLRFDLWRCKTTVHGLVLPGGHDHAEGVTSMSCLPAHLADRTYYTPTDRGHEVAIKDALTRAHPLRRK